MLVAKEISLKVVFLEIFIDLKMPVNGWFGCHVEDKPLQKDLHHAAPRHHAGQSVMKSVNS